MRLLVEKERDVKFQSLVEILKDNLFILETAIKRDRKSPANIKEILWIGLKKLDEFIDGGMCRLCLECNTKYTIVQPQLYRRTGRYQNFERPEMQFNYE